MKTFHCDRCDGLLFFDSVSCVGCGAGVAFLPGEDRVAPWSGTAYRPCANWASIGCNWAIGPSEGGELCASCRLTRTIPDLGVDGNWTGVLTSFDKY